MFQGYNGDKVDTTGEPLMRSVRTYAHGLGARLMSFSMAMFKDFGFIPGIKVSNSLT